MLVGVVVLGGQSTFRFNATGQVTMRLGMVGLSSLRVAPMLTRQARAVSREFVPVPVMLVFLLNLFPTAVLYFEV